MLQCFSETWTVQFLKFIQDFVQLSVQLHISDYNRYQQPICGLIIVNIDRFNYALEYYTYTQNNYEKHKITFISLFKFDLLNKFGRPIMDIQCVGIEDTYTKFSIMAFSIILLIELTIKQIINITIIHIFSEKNITNLY